jgi:uncharacterized OB-fold protein
MTTTIDVRAGIFRQTPQGKRLSGSRCGHCGTTHFPPTALCFACLSEAVEEVALDPVGTLFSYTTVYMKTAHFEPPYSIGYVDLPEGVRVFAPLRTDSTADLAVGQKMQIEIGPLWSEADGTPVIGYRFHPC